MGALDAFKVVIIVQLFFAFCITLVSHSLPADMRPYVDSFEGVSDQINLNNTAQKVQTSLEKQTRIPLIDIGALVFYSGNIIIDLLLNFVFAFPEMVGLLVYGLTVLFNINQYLVIMVQLFVSVIVVALYFLGLIQTILQLRSGSKVF